MLSERVANPPASVVSVEGGDKRKYRNTHIHIHDGLLLFSVFKIQLYGSVGLEAIVENPFPRYHTVGSNSRPCGL